MQLGNMFHCEIHLRLFELPGVFIAALEHMRRKCLSGTYGDFIHGKMWQNFNFEQTTSIVMPYILYFDDFETANVLGSRAGVHKLGSVYSCLKCFPPRINSQLKNLLLVLLFFSQDRSQSGNEAIFDILVKEINFIRHNGICINVRGTEYKVRER